MLATWLVGAFATPALPQGVPAAAVKATFLYRFAGYVDWPPPLSAAPLTIAIVENEDVARQLEQLVPGITLNGHSAALKRLRGGDSLDGIHVLYVGSSTSVQARALRDAARNRPVLLVADSPRGLADGAVINFLGPGPTVRFEISLSNAGRAGLRINSRLLSVAARVEGKLHSSIAPVPSPGASTSFTSGK